jgi:hypothetical protein
MNSRSFGLFDESEPDEFSKISARETKTKAKNKKSYLKHEC